MVGRNPVIRSGILTASSRIDPHANFWTAPPAGSGMQSAHDPAFCRQRLILVKEARIDLICRSKSSR
jgi:hypothetical protein